MSTPLKKLCNNEDLSQLKYINRSTLLLLVDSSFTSLFLCKGVRNLSKKILVYLKLISSNYLTNISNVNIKLPPYMELKMTGVTTIPIFENLELEKIQQELLYTTNNFQEYKRDKNNLEFNILNEKIKYVLGGTAFLGNPSSFHNNLVRKIRLIAQKIVNEKIFNPLLKNLGSNQNIQMLIDRLMIRNPGLKPTAETWHRDVVPSNMILDDDIIYGGWINLDNKDQYFSCVLGSHLDIKLKNLNSGFSTIPKDDVKSIGKLKTQIKIPPGHLIIFPQYLLHEIVSKSNSYTMKRLFIGWKQTKSTDMFYKDFVSRLKTQSIMMLPSGQEPPMYAKMHIVFHKDLLIKWSDTSIEKSILIDYTDKYNNINKICPRFMGSLLSYNFKLYSEYTEDEINQYKPLKII